MSDEPVSPYSPEMLRGLGLVTLEFSRLDATALEMLGMLTSQDNATAQIIAAGQNVSWALDLIRALIAQKLRDGSLRTALEIWAQEARAVIEVRNRIVHDRWMLNVARTMRTRLRKQEVVHDFQEWSPEQLIDVARRMWVLHREGQQLLFDIAGAGFGRVITVSDTATETQHPAMEFPVAGEVSGRPDPPPNWPGGA
jgi:hypothetical protein